MLRVAAILLAVGAVAPATASVAGSERSWSSPKETDSVLMAEQQLEMGFSPRPTPAPQPRGVFGRMDLVPRLDGYTLGPATCGFVKSNGNGKKSGSVLTALACYTTSGTATLLDYDPSWSLTHSFPSSTSTTSQSSTTASSTTSQTSAATTTGGGEGGGGSSTNVGAIAGGTVGGVAALGLVGLAAFLLMRRKKKGKDSDTHSSPQPPMSQHTAQSPPQGYPPTSPAPQSYQGYSPAPQAPYDPHMSMYSQQQPYSPQSGYQQQYSQQYPQQYPQQGGYPQQYGAGGFPVSSTGSPPPHTTPSPNVTNDNREHGGVPASPHGASPPPGGEHGHQQPQELGTVAPIGNEGNRAELS
ncbi:3-beta hydroxysteroid dehydrogenase/isomerase [Purpureocillium lavendulum]|uniref:3-beta hydroxysteroid dehydrogenase/isomerase n=1 Tax=Purpureocillium lavendulum TaxID=1247861 RepID=A0AB34G3X0_9HYPO|nr:3-beta hydroxysteroid dehydrogenase/isomerase [Purpureocillium lavendulum]